MNEKKNLYSVTLQEINGSFRIVEAEKMQPINQYRGVMRRVNARNLARNINRGKLVIK